MPDWPTNQLAGALVLAVLGAAIKVVVDGLSARRASRLKRLDLQLEQVYGPLFALSHAANEAWSGFRSIYRVDKGSYWRGADQPTAAEAAAWRLWMTEVFMPLNERMEAAVVGHAHLLEDDEMPPVLLALCAHVETYRGILKQWESGDYSRHLAAVDFPKGLAEYARQNYTRLKHRQAALVRAGA